MVQYRQKRITGITDDRWVRISTLSALSGGVLLALIGIALHSVLNEAQFAVVDPLGVVAMILLALGLPMLYLSERHWFGSLAKGSFGLMAAGWIIAAIALPIAVFGPGVAFLVFLLGLLVAMLGAFAFGIVMLRSGTLRVPRLGAWLLIAALPIGLPSTVAFTGYVMGEFADPWAGPMLLYGLAWVIFANYLRTHQHEVVAPTAISQ